MSEAEPLTIAPAPLGGAEAQALIAALNAEIATRYPDPVDQFFSLAEDEVGPGRGVFLIARAGGLAVGCGALRRLDEESAEIKRMYVAPAARGRRLGARLLAALEDEARRLGVTRLLLETGTRQPEAVALYARAGFAPIPAFGAYVGATESLCFGKSLTAGAGQPGSPET